MNGLQGEIWDGLKGLTLLGTLRLLWVGLTKGWALLQSRLKQGTDARHVTVEEKRLDHDQSAKVGDQALAFAHELHLQLQAQITRTDKLEEKADRLAEKVETEAEQRRMAWISVEVAQIRADEADEARDKALKELSRLQATNAELERRLQEQISLRVEDQKMIAFLQGEIAFNADKILKLQAKLEHFESAAYTLTPVETPDKGSQA